MDSHQRRQLPSHHNDGVAKPEPATQDIQKLKDENKALKEIIAMMRESVEVEAAVSDESPAESSRDRIIERQLSLCRQYLNLLLNTSNVRTTKYDELLFLRSKNQELLQMIDQLRHESLTNTSSSQYPGKQSNGDVPSMQEQQLISRLEEATDEIDALLQERDQLMKLSNELKFELQLANQQIQASVTNHTMGQELARDEGSTGMLDAILNDFSASHDGESQEESGVVACIGKKPPTGKASTVSAICNCPRYIIYMLSIPPHLG